jgi:hypothetical protein
MMRVKSKNIHILPTKNSSRLSHNKDGVLELHRLQWRKGTQNMYITSDEKPKQGDWVIANGGIRFVTSINNDKSKTFTDDGIISKQSPSSYCHLKHYKKIILTTDQDLIKDGIQAIDDEFLEWFVEKANDSGKPIDIIELRLKGNLIEGYHTVPLGQIAPIYLKYQIIIPKEKPKQEKDYTALLQPVGTKQETLEEVAEKQYSYASYEAFIRGAKWQQEQIGNSEFLQRLRATKSDAEARRLIFKQFKNK